MKTNTHKILIVEDDLLSRLNLKVRLESIGEIYEASTIKEAFASIENEIIDLAFVDLDLDEELIGLEIVAKLKALQDAYIVVLSGREDESIVEKSYANGCNDYLAKPFTKTSIELIIKKYNASKNKNQTLKKLKDIFLTEDNSLIKELKTIEQALLSKRPILITGESGTGKTFLAKFIHQLSDEKSSLVHLNCAEISESLIESVLFGHKKGAFTGAQRDKKGLLEMADGGFLFLDEIATLPIAIQKKLLKAIEEKSFYPLGSEKIVKSDFRLISATCEDLKSKIELGEFRTDFFFRIEGFNVRLKSLRERKDDLNNLIQHFVKKGERRIAFDSSAKKVLQDYHWPGNIRELERIIEVLQTREQGIFSASDLLPILRKENVANESKIDLEKIKQIGLKSYVEDIESSILKMVLESNEDKVRKTLADLKISNNSYYRILENINSKEKDHA